MAKHRGHKQSAATRAKISAKLKGRHRGGNSAARAKVREQKRSNKLSSRAATMNRRKAAAKVRAHNRKPGATRRSLARTRQAPKGYKFGQGGKLVKSK